MHTVDTVPFLALPFTLQQSIDMARVQRNNRPKWVSGREGKTAGG